MNLNAGIALADEIEREIVDAYLEPGQLFATEEELRPRHDSGRSTIRQAARILEQRGVACMRRGVGGGLIIMQPDPEAIGRMLAMVIGSRLGNFFDMLRLVKATDASIIPTGIGQIDLTACDKLREMADRNEQMPVDEFLMSRAHWQLLRTALGAIGNPASMLAYQTWNEINADLIPHSMQVSETRRRGEYWALTLQAVEELIAGDIAALFELRSRQIAFAVDWHAWRKMESHRPLSPSLNSPNLVDFSAGRHGAARLIRELLHQIRLRDWEEDAKLGGYAELMEQFGASAAVLRQATRMLEECSAIYTRRGRNGGIFIGRPDEEMPVSRAARYIRQSKVSPDTLRSLLAQILLECLSQVPDRASSSTIAHLKASIAKAAAAEPGKVQADLSLAIASASGNAALEIWVKILLNSLPPCSAVSGQIHADAVKAYKALEESIDIFDTGRSRRALLQLLMHAELEGRGSA